MSKLQQALSQVQAPKVDVRQAVQGAQYRGATQQAKGVDTTNYTGKILNIVNDFSGVASHVIDQSWEQANKNLMEAKSKGVPPEQMLAEKAKTESYSLGHRIVLGMADPKAASDPLAYTKAITLNSEMKQRQFDNAKVLENRVRNGDFIDPKELDKARQELADSDAKELAETYGVSPDNAFISEGRAAEYDLTTRVLHEGLYRVADEKMRVDRQQTYVKERNMLLQQGVNDPAVFMSQIDQLEQNGTINTAKEKAAYVNELADELAKLGRVDMLNGLLNEETTMNGVTAKLGDILEPETRNALMLTADEKKFEMDAALSDQYSRMVGEAQAMAVTDPHGALKKWDAIGEWYSSKSGTNVMTSQRRQLQNGRNNLLVQQAQFNYNKTKELVKKQKAAEDKSGYAAIFDQAFTAGGDFVDTNPLVHGYSTETANAVINERIMGIQEQMQSGQIGGKEGMQMINTIMAKSPTNTGAGAGYKQGISRQLDSFDNAVTMIQTGQAVNELPAPVRNLIGLYETDPVALSKQMEPKDFARVSAIKDSRDRYGDKMAMQIASNSKPLQEMELRTFNEQLTKQMPYANTAQSNTMQQLTEHYMGLTGNVDKAFEMAEKKYTETHPVIEMADGSRLSNRVMTPSSGTQNTTLVKAEVESTLEEMRKSAPRGTVITAIENGDGIRFYNATDSDYFDTNADELYAKANNRAFTAEVERQAKMREGVANRVNKKANMVGTYDMRHYGVPDKKPTDKPKAHQPSMQDFWQKKP